MSADFAAGGAAWCGVAGRCPCWDLGRLSDGFPRLAPNCRQCSLDDDFAEASNGLAAFVEEGRLDA